MKRLLFCLSFILFPVSWNLLSAGEDYHENIDSLLHKVEGHRQGFVILDNEGIKMKAYESYRTKASNDKYYYRWFDGYIDFHTFEPFYYNPKPLPYGYRHEGEKMYVYNFLTEEESVAYDFALQPGEHFTTPDGVCWEVVDRRKMSFKSELDVDFHQFDFNDELVVLSLKSVDGTLTDEWVQYIGSIHYPIQTMESSDIKCVRTAFFNLGDMDDKLVYFNFAEDPLYGQYVEVLPDSYANTELTRNYSIAVGNESLNIAINYYTWFTRHYCYTYRSGNTFDLHSFELGPYLDDGDATPSFGLTFPGAPSFESYNVIYNGEQLSSSIKASRTEDDAMLQDGQSFDLTGRRLTTRPMKGLYIQGGEIRVSCGK